jgi:hypothetical protein
VTENLEIFCKILKTKQALALLVQRWGGTQCQIWFWWILLWWPWLLAWNKLLKRTKAIHINRGRDDPPFNIMEMYIHHMMWFGYWLDVLDLQYIESEKSASHFTTESQVYFWSSSWSWVCQEQYSLLISDLVNYCRKATCKLLWPACSTPGAGPLVANRPYLFISGFILYY